MSDLHKSSSIYFCPSPIELTMHEVRWFDLHFCRGRPVQNVATYCYRGEPFHRMEGDGSGAPNNDPWK